MPLIPRRKKKTKKESTPVTEIPAGIKPFLEKKEETVNVSTANGDLYPEIKASLCSGDKAITAEKAKELLGWKEEEEKEFGTDFHFKDFHGKKIRCYNNISNRPIVAVLLSTYRQEHLKGRWKLNGETVIVGVTGQVLEGQHTLISLVLASQEWNDDKEKWSDFRSDEPVLEKVVVFGIQEDDSTVNTINTGRPRSLADVIFRSEYFSAMTKSDRKKVARIADYAVRLSWDRTGSGIDGFSPHRTHTESLDFIARHPGILECVKHIYEEEGDEKQLSRYLSPGYASAMCYLMASCQTDPETYLSNRCEDALDQSQLDKAQEFWVLLASGEKSVRPVLTALGKIIDDDGGSVGERLALITKAWNHFVAGETLTTKRLALKYHTDEDGIRTLAECPTVGGIDIGDPREAHANLPPSKEEIEEGKKAEKKKRAAKKSSNTKTDFKVGDHVWVHDNDGDTWDGELTAAWEDNGVKLANVKTADGEYETPYSTLSESEV